MEALSKVLHAGISLYIFRMGNPTGTQTTNPDSVSALHLGSRPQNICQERTFPTFPAKL